MGTRLGVAHPSRRARRALLREWVSAYECAMTVARGGWRVRLLTLWLPLGVSLVFALFPFYWIAITSLKSNQELYTRKVTPLIVPYPTLKHYLALLTATNLPLWPLNTL